MSRKLISVALTILSGTAVAWAAACSSTPASTGKPVGGSSSSSGAGSSSSSSSSGAGTSSSGAGSSSSGAGGSSGSHDGGGGTFVKIDDMESVGPDGGSNNGPIELTGYPTGQFPGYWYEGVGSADARNTVTPTPYTYSLLPAPHTTMPNIMSTHGAHVACAVWDQYGYCQQAFEFAQVNSGDAGPSDSGGPVPRTTVAYDISGYTGITFWTMAGANMTPGGIRVLFPDIDSDPRGGRCAVGDAGACYDSWSYEIPAAMVTTAWTQVNVAYAPMNGVLGLQSFGNEATNFDPTHVYGITFQVSGPQVKDASAAVNADYWIDDIYFTK